MIDNRTSMEAHGHSRVECLTVSAQTVERRLLTLASFLH